MSTTAEHLLDREGDLVLVTASSGDVYLGTFEEGHTTAALLSAAQAREVAEFLNRAASHAEESE